MADCRVVAGERCNNSSGSLPQLIACFSFNIYWFIYSTSVDCLLTCCEVSINDKMIKFLFITFKLIHKSTFQVK